MLPLTGNIFEIMGQHLFKWRDNYSIRTRKAVPLLRNSERQIALTIPSARRGVRVPSKSQVSPIFWRTRMGDRRVAHVDARRVREPRYITLFPQNPSLVYQTGQQCGIAYLSHFQLFYRLISQLLRDSDDCILFQCFR